MGMSVHGGLHDTHVGAADKSTSEYNLFKEEKTAGGDQEKFGIA